MIKVLTLLGTRPEVIRTSRITPKLDKYCQHTIVHTNQNYTPNLKDIFFEELGLRQPDICFKTSDEIATHTEHGLGAQLGRMFPQIEKVFKDIKPDKVFILGDTNSALCTIMAERMGIPVYHMEAANRSFNRIIPEEVNRRLIDHTASYNLFYTPTNRHTLLNEGCDPKKIFQCGNPTLEVLEYYKDKIGKNTVQILEKYGLAHPDAGYTNFCLADFHRTENVDNPARLYNIICGLNYISSRLNLPVICSVHPRTKSKLENLDIPKHEGIIFLDAMGFFDFVGLEKLASVILTDSGLVSEEACILQVPCVIIRNETERPEVVEAGGAIISGVDSAERIFECTKQMLDYKGKTWRIPEGYNDLNVSDKVIAYILGKSQ